MTERQDSSDPSESDERDDLFAMQYGHKRLLDNGEPAPLSRMRCHGYCAPEADELSMESAKLPPEALAREAAAVLDDPPQLPSRTEDRRE